MFTFLVTSLYFGLIVALSIRIINRRLPVGSALAWILILFTLPVAGVALYYLVGEHKTGRERARNGGRIKAFYRRLFGVDEGTVSIRDLPVAQSLVPMAQLVSRQTGFFPIGGNDLEIFSEAGPTFDAMIADIDRAEKTLWLEFYIIDPEGRVLDVLEALKRARQRGVQVRILADGLGSSRFLMSAVRRELEDAGAIVTPSLPLGLIKSFFIRSDLRNHRKLLIIDEKLAWTGSGNLADPDFFKQDKHAGKWVDVMLRLTGRGVESLSAVFHADWALDNRHEMKAEWPEPLPESDRPADSPVILQVIPSGPDDTGNTIYESVVMALHNARSSVTITTPYLILDTSLMLALTNAAHRGVSVNIILPRRCDSVMVRHASRSYYEELLAAGINLYLYGPDLLHTKSIVIDDSLSLVGSLNIDLRSFYLNLEITLAIYDKDINAALRELHKTYAASCEKLTLESWQARSRWQEFLDNAVRLLSPVL